ncbi:unnamed protein product, partial [Onchocerca ochengi]|uniref:Fe2OG dioxygenase domain-containing protein n=1 Tax=Onchocerca ochengi TaxID=42157 RepID=A0A182EV45_ONCOC
MVNPDHPRAKENVKGYEDLLENNGIQRFDMRRDIPPINNVRDENDSDEGIMLTYEALCRLEVPVAQSRLYCYYKMDRPYLRLAPFKVETVRQNPLAILFYNIISDEEARIIQVLAVNKAYLILLAFARLKPTEHEIVKRIDMRLELATNLEIETAEDLTVLNYGIGGQYEPHFDCALISVISTA